MRGMLKAPLVGGLMVLLALGFALYTLHLEDEKTSALRSKEEQLTQVKEGFLFLYDLISLEKLFVVETLRKNVEKLTASELDTLEKNWKEFLEPDRDYMEEIAGFFNGKKVGPYVVSTQYRSGRRTVRVQTFDGWYPLVEIDQEGGEFIVDLNHVKYHIPLQGRQHIIPIPLRVLAEVVKTAKAYQLSFPSYVGLFNHGNRVCLTYSVAVNNCCPPEGSYIYTCEPLNYTKIIDALNEDSLRSFGKMLKDLTGNRLKEELNKYPNQLRILNVTCKADETPSLDANLYNCLTGTSSSISPQGYLFTEIYCSIEAELKYLGMNPINVSFEIAVPVKDPFQIKPGSSLQLEANADMVCHRGSGVCCRP